MQRIKQGDVTASKRVAVFDDLTRRGLCEEEVSELSPEQHKPDRGEQTLRKTWAEGMVRPALGAEASAARSGTGQQAGMAGTERAKRRVGRHTPPRGTSNSYQVTATSAAETYRLQQI